MTLSPPPATASGYHAHLWHTSMGVESTGAVPLRVSKYENWPLYCPAPTRFASLTLNFAHTSWLGPSSSASGTLGLDRSHT